MPNLDLSRKSVKFLEGLPAKQFRQISLALIGLTREPFPADARPLKGHDPYHRIDVGEYRVIYRLEDDTAKIALIGKRNDDAVYREFRRQR